MRIHSKFHYLIIGFDVFKCIFVCVSPRSHTHTVDFYRLIGDTPPASYIPRKRLFPRAIATPGWKHMWDGILQYALWTLQWFPLWLSQFKAIVALLRDVSYREVLCDALRTEALYGLTDMIETTKMVAFTVWRWSKLHLCCAALSPIVRSLRAHFNPRWFRQFKDTVRTAQCHAALQSDRWLLQFDFISWISKNATQILSRGGLVHMPSSELPCR